MLSPPLMKGLVIGDIMLDRFIRGNVNRISPEAPVPVVRVTERSTHLGGAANVARNISAIDYPVSIAGRIGNDPAGEELLRIFQTHNINTQGVLHSKNLPTTCKTRIVAKQHQIVRFDEETEEPLNQEEEEAFCELLNQATENIDYIILEDYGKGILSPKVIEYCKKTLSKKAPIFVDPNINSKIDWKGFFAIKPNWSEACHATGLPHEYLSQSNITEQTEPVIEKLLQKWDPQHLLVTLGEYGMLYATKNGTRIHIKPKAREVFDVSGAGDTGIAIFALALAHKLSGENAAILANSASSKVVAKPGTATLTPEEFSSLCIEEVGKKL